MCARRASCNLGLGTLNRLWVSLWSPTGASLLCGALGTDCPSCTGSFGVCYCFCRQAWVICCLCNRSSQQIVAKEENCKTKGTASLPSTCSCGALPVVTGGESHPALLDSSLQPLGWVGVLCNLDTMQAFPHFWGASTDQAGWAGASASA